MLRYDTEIKPGLVALYDIRPGNGAGLFLNPTARTGDLKESLNLFHCLTGNKWWLCSIGVMWSNYLPLVTTHTAEFSTAHHC